ncbi:hypothetical protein [Gordonia aichiensis]|uniref:hypothetical protein n=1 Tax=Gordonia aichiensis TaxID=36820 RepID=UPI001FE22922|nr:hypothetical protein [Gordonia aichiensis]
MSDLARMSGAIPDRLTWLLPVVIDVFILQATWCVYAATTPASDTTSRCWRSPAQSVSPAMPATHSWPATRGHARPDGRGHRHRGAPGPAGKHPRPGHARLGRRGSNRAQPDAGRRA